jgi:hypothetical protein
VLLSIMVAVTLGRSAHSDLDASGVPYFSQWESAELAARFVDGSLPLAEDPRWAASGARPPAEYEYWAGKVCGLACLKMILAHRGLPVPGSPSMSLRSFGSGRSPNWLQRIPPACQQDALIPVADFAKFFARRGLVVRKWLPGR